MKQNNSLPDSLRGENYAIIAQDKHARIYPGELVRVATLREMQSLQTSGKVVTFLTPSRLMQEAEREAIGNEPILAIVSAIKNVQYMNTTKLAKILARHGNNNFSLGEFTPNMTDDIYANKARGIQKHIANGDICQAVLARHFASPITGMNVEKTPLTMLLRLLMIRGTYMTALFRMDEASYLYASPERHLTIKNNRAITNPIAGTMKIGDPETLQGRLEEFAFHNQKEAQELAMLLDEGTKIIAEFCPHGEIEGPFLRETGAVIHTEYRISGRVVSGTHVIDALRKTLNAPTLTGSPINRACQVIAGLEDISRGYYGGVFGVYKNSGNIDTAIAIRGVILDHKNSTVTQSAGAGITLDSEPYAEAGETSSKSAGVRRVLTSQTTEMNQVHLSHTSARMLEQRMRIQRNIHLNSFLMRKQENLEHSPELMGKKVTVINFDDNFAHILGVMIQSLGAHVRVVSYKEYEPDEDILVCGGGPGNINDANDSKMNRLREILTGRGETPLLGICLGCQAICQHLGLEVKKLSKPLQGNQAETTIGENKTEKVGHYNSFAGFGERQDCEIHKNSDGSIDLIHCPEKKMLGVQFHPESVMTKNGREILKDLLQKLVFSSVLKKFLKSRDIQVQIKMLSQFDAQMLNPKRLMEAIKILEENREMSYRVPHSLEIVGTGGSGLPRINTSTLTSLILARKLRGKLPLVKFGGRAASGKCGSIDLLESLGYTRSRDEKDIYQRIARDNACFMPAGQIYPVLEHISLARKQYGQASLMNFILPLICPAGSHYQCIGCSREDMMIPMAKAAIGLGRQHVIVVRGHDGLDEISLTGPTDIVQAKADGTIKKHVVTPEQFGFSRCSFHDIAGGDISLNTAIARGILDGTCRSRHADLIEMNCRVVEHFFSF